MAERDDRELSPEEQAAAEAQAAKRRKRLIYGVIAAAVLVLVLGGIIIWLLLREPDPEIQAAQRSEERRVGKESRSRWMRSESIKRVEKMTTHTSINIVN